MAQVRGMPPWIDLEVERRLADAVLDAIEAGAAALGARRRARAACGGAGRMLHRRAGQAVGRAHRAREMIRGDALLFSESQSRIVVSLQRAKPRRACKRSPQRHRRADPSDRRRGRHALCDPAAGAIGSGRTEGDLVYVA